MLQTLTLELAAFPGMSVATRGPGHVPYDYSFLQDTFVLKKLCSKVTLGVHDAPDLDPRVGRVSGRACSQQGSGTCSKWLLLPTGHFCFKETLIYSSLGTLHAVLREVGQSASGAILYTIDTVRLEAFARLEKSAEKCEWAWSCKASRARIFLPLFWQQLAGHCLSTFDIQWVRISLPLYIFNVAHF